MFNSATHLLTAVFCEVAWVQWCGRPVGGSNVSKRCSKTEKTEPVFFDLHVPESDLSEICIYGASRWDYDKDHFHHVNGCRIYCWMSIEPTGYNRHKLEVLFRLQTGCMKATLLLSEKNPTISEEPSDEEPWPLCINLHQIWRISHDCKHSVPLKRSRVIFSQSGPDLARLASFFPCAPVYYIGLTAYGYGWQASVINTFPESSAAIRPIHESGGAVLMLLGKTPVL